MSNNKILVVDDESRIRKLLNDFLQKSGYDVIEAADGEEALRIFSEDNSICLIILDVMMPKLDGFMTLREIRRNSKIPVIMLTAKVDEQDELLGFEYGVDEYIQKPFSPKIVVARVGAILKRVYDSEEELFVYGNLSIDFPARRVMCGDEEVELSYKEFELLSYLVKNKGIALSREKILDSVWSYDYFGDERTIDTHVKKLRAKLKGAGEYIKTVWGMGYKFGD